MKFEKFGLIHNALWKAGAINESTTSKERKEIYDAFLEEDKHFDYLQHDEKSIILESFFLTTDEIDEDLVMEGFAWAFIKSPIKATKILTNAKKLQKALITQATLELDLKKRIEAASGEDREKASELKDKAREVHELKTKALEETIDSLKARMDDLAGTDEKLRLLASNMKTKAKLGAYTKLLKAADAEEKKELGIKIQKEKDKLLKQDEVIKGYEKNISDADKKKAEDDAREAEAKAKKEAEDEAKKQKEAAKAANDDIKNLMDANKASAEEIKGFEEKKKEYETEYGKSHISKEKFNELNKKMDDKIAATKQSIKDNDAEIEKIKKELSGK